MTVVRGTQIMGHSRLLCSYQLRYIDELSLRVAGVQSTDFDCHREHL